VVISVREQGRGQGVAPRGGSGIEYAGFRVYVVEGITQWAKHPAPGVAGSPSALNRGSATDLLL
jgi:hypothetical protein